MTMTKGEALHGVMSVLSRTNWSAVRALHAVTTDFDHTGRVWYSGNWWHSPWALMQQLDPKVDAAEIPIMFWGGPPKDRKYRPGTVFEYLVDSCMYELAEGDPDLHLWNFLNHVCERVDQGCYEGAP